MDMNECAICLEPTIDEPTGDSINDIITTPCKHTFHINCLKYWIEKKEILSCPDCRQPIPPMAE